MANKTVLVVDDSRLARMMMANTITRNHPGYVVVAVGSGAEALQRVADHAPDMALVDLNMPGMNGMELVAKLLEQLPNLPIAVVTANIQDQVRLRAEAMGLRFLDKPVTDQKVAALLADFAQTHS